MSPNVPPPISPPSPPAAQKPFRDATELLWIGLLVGVFGGYALFVQMNRVIQTEFAAFIVPLTIIIATLILLLFLVFLFRRRLIEGVFGVSRAGIAGILMAVVDVVEASHSRSRQEAYDRARELSGKIGATASYWLLRAFIVRSILALIVVFAGSLTIVIMSQQNKLLDRQNEELQTQTVRADTQNALLNLQIRAMEMDRRRIYDDDLKRALSALDDVAAGKPAAENLANIVRRAAANFAPYYYYSPPRVTADASKSLTLAALEPGIRYLSPERGQILDSLVQARLSITEADALGGYSEYGNFAYSDGRGRQFRPGLSPDPPGSDPDESVVSEPETGSPTAGRSSPASLGLPSASKRRFPPVSAEDDPTPGPSDDIPATNSTSTLDSGDLAPLVNPKPEVTISRIDYSDFTGAEFSRVHILPAKAVFDGAEFFECHFALHPSALHLPQDSTFEDSVVELSLEQFRRSLRSPLGLTIKWGTVFIISVPQADRAALRQLGSAPSLQELYAHLGIPFPQPEEQWRLQLHPKWQTMIIEQLH